MGAVGSVPYQNDMHVVIIGGGYGGAYLTTLLKKKNFCKVTVIDPKDCMVHCVAALRACVQKGYAKKVLVPLEEIAGDSFVRGKAVKVDQENKTVILESGVKITYTHLVIATGTNSPFPGKIASTHPNVSIEEGLKVYDDFVDEIGKSSHVVCVGGGPVGVELSAEIKTEFPDKEVTLIQSKTYLGSEKLKTDVKEAMVTGLEELGVKIMFGERVQNLDELTLVKSVKGQVVKTESGKGIVADLVISCIGNHTNTDFCKDVFASSLTESGQLKVDEFFQVKDQEGVFAIGDVTDIIEEKLCYVAKFHAEHLIANWIADTSSSQRKPYVPGDFMMLVPLGRNGGTGQIKGFTLGNMTVRYLKSKDLFSSKVWGDVGLKPPKT